MAIPEIEIHYRVRYRMTGCNKEFETKSYPTLEMADDQRRMLISQYDTVYFAYLLPVHPSEEVIRG